MDARNALAILPGRVRSDHDLLLPADLQHPLLPPALPRRRPRRDRARRVAGKGARIRHLVLPGIELRAARARRRDTVARFAARERWPLTRLPTICILNGQPLPRALWRRRRLRLADDVVFLSKPFGQGAGGEAAGLAGILALIALTAIAGPAGPLVSSGVYSAVAGSVISGGLAVGGSLLIERRDVSR